MDYSKDSTASTKLFLVISCQGSEKVYKVPKYLLGNWTAFLLVLLDVRDDDRNDPTTAVAYQADKQDSSSVDKLSRCRTKPSSKVKFGSIDNAF